MNGGSMIRIMLTLTMVIAGVVVANGSCPVAPGAASCGAASNRHVEKSSGWKSAEMVCCCKTHSGGECCTRATQCGGTLPGCFCAFTSVPGANFQQVFTGRAGRM